MKFLLLILNVFIDILRYEVYKKKANKNDIYFLMKMFKVNHISWSIKMNMKGDGKGYGYWKNIIF